MPLAAGLLLGPTTCVHCSRTSDGAERCACAAGFHEPPTRRHDAADTFLAAQTYFAHLGARA